MAKVKNIYNIALLGEVVRAESEVKFAPTNRFIRVFGKKSLRYFTEKPTLKYYIFAPELSKLANYDGNFTKNPEESHFIPIDGG